MEYVRALVKDLNIVTYTAELSFLFGRLCKTRGGPMPFAGGNSLVESIRGR